LDDGAWFLDPPNLHPQRCAGVISLALKNRLSSSSLIAAPRVSTGQDFRCLDRIHAWRIFDFAAAVQLYKLDIAEGTVAQKVELAIRKKGFGLNDSNELFCGLQVNTRSSRVLYS